MTPLPVRIYRRALDVLLPERWLVRRFIACHLPALAPTEGLCLDLGGGHAPFAASLAMALPAMPRVVVDLVPGSRTSVIGDAHRLPFPAGRAGFVAMFQVIQHLEHPPAVLAECGRILGPGGLLLISYPFLTCEGRSRDLRRWTIPGIETELRAAGFQPVVHEALGGPCFLVTALIAHAPGRFLILHRQGWRTGRSPGDALRLALAFAAALPFHLLGFAALLLDRAIRRPAHYSGGIVLARRRDDA